MGRLLKRIEAKRNLKKISEEYTVGEIRELIYDEKNKQEILNSINKEDLKDIIKEDAKYYQDQYYEYREYEDDGPSVDSYVYNKLCDCYDSDKVDVSILECCELDEKWEKYFDNDIFDKELYALIVESDLMFDLINSVAYKFDYDDFDERTYDVNEEIAREYDRMRI